MSSPEQAYQPDPALTQADKDLIQKAFSNPLEIPEGFLSWLKNKLSSDGEFTIGVENVYGLKRQLAAASVVPTTTNKSAKAHRTGVNNAAYTAITFATSDWDDFGVAGTFISLTNNYSVVPAAGKYLVIARGIVSGQSGAGNGSIRVDRLDNAGVFVETICDDVGWALNQNVACSGIANFGANERIQVLTTNGATGTAGTVAPWLSVMQL